MLCPFFGQLLLGATRGWASCFADFALFLSHSSKVEGKGPSRQGKVEIEVSSCPPPFVLVSAVLATSSSLSSSSLPSHVSCHTWNEGTAHWRKTHLPDGVALSHKKNKTVLDKDPTDVKLAKGNTSPLTHILPEEHNAVSMTKAEFLLWV